MKIIDMPMKPKTKLTFDISSKEEIKKIMNWKEDDWKRYTIKITPHTAVSKCEICGKNFPSVGACYECFFEALNLGLSILRKRREQRVLSARKRGKS